MLLNCSLLIQDSLILDQLLFTLVNTAQSEIEIHAQERIKTKWCPGPKHILVKKFGFFSISKNSVSKKVIFYAGGGTLDARPL